MDDPVRFGVLGPLEMHVGGTVVSLGTPQQRAVLAMLVINRNRAVGIESLINAVWQEKPPATARATLSTYVSNLRRLMSTGGVDPHTVLAGAARGYRLVVADDQCDVARFTAEKDSGLAAAACGEFEQASRHLSAALAEWRAPVLEDMRGYTFVDAFARALDEERLEAHTTLAEAEIALGRPSAVIGRLEALTLEHPYREPLWAQLITAFYLAGRQADALDAYRRLRTTLADDLGIEPSPAIRALHERILRQQDLDSEGAAPSAEALDFVVPKLESGRAEPISQGPTGQRKSRRRLPGLLASFVGRRAELSELATMLSTSRLVTVSGTGGVGKTSLAMQAACQLSQRFPDGVSLVELGDLRDGSLLIEVTATALGMRDQTARPQADALVDFLGDRAALVVFDNCEHIVDDAARLVETLLCGCPELRILTTSREILDVAGESVLPLAPLMYPTPGADTTPMGLDGYDAVKLFVERARTAVAGFALTEQNATTIAGICARLEGLPLAIELAAARLRIMPPEQIADGLSDRYRLLTRGRRGAPPRQQTLAWCVQWSYDLCTEREQQLWTRLSVFAGSFELHAAHHICAKDFDVEDFLDELSALVDKSILIRTEHDGAVRFRLLETLREYGRSKIADRGQWELLSRRHAQWYCRLVTEASANLFGTEQLQWIHRLAGEMPNIREALQASLSDSPATAVAMAAAMRGTWVACGMLSEARHWLDLALDAAPEPTAQRIKALCAAALIANLQVDVPTARIRTEEARGLLDMVGDPVAYGRVESLDGYAAMLSGNIEGAREYMQNALDATDDPEVHAACMVLMGLLSEVTGDQGQAMAWFEKGLSLCESHGESLWRSKLMMCVGRGRWLQGQPQAAEQLLMQSLQLCHAANDPLTGAQCLEGLAWYAGCHHDARRATVLMAAAAELTRRNGFPLHPLAHMEQFHTECERRAYEALDATEFEAAWDEGAALTFDEAVSTALGASG